MKADNNTLNQVASGLRLLSEVEVVGMQMSENIFFVETKSGKLHLNARRLLEEAGWIEKTSGFDHYMGRETWWYVLSGVGNETSPST